MVIKLRPIDELRRVLDDSRALEVWTHLHNPANSFKQFKAKYGDVEFCAMLTVLASGLTPTNEIGTSPDLTHIHWFRLFYLSRHTRSSSSPESVTVAVR